MAVGIITGSGTYALPGFEDGETALVETPYGPATVTSGLYNEVPVLHVARHGAGHSRISNLVNHRANIWALAELGATAAIGLTACGATDPALELGTLVIFDDLYFVSNRLPDGSLCTFFVEVDDPARGHWVLHGGPFSERLGSVLMHAAQASGQRFRHGGVYGHVDGPRFNTPVEIASLAAVGVAAVSQTGGPETVLCGELELPFALVGFVTDYANGVMPGAPTPVATLLDLIGRSSQTFADLLSVALPEIEAAGPPDAAGSVLRLAANQQ
jgi:5'-methylthioadenosine phosphorylase